MTGPPGVVLGGGEGPLLGTLGVVGGLQLRLHAGREAVAGADRGDQSAGGQLAEGGVGVGVADQRRQVRLVGHLAAEGDGEAQGGAGGRAEPGGEQRGRRGGLAERGQGDLVGRVQGQLGRLADALEDAVLVDRPGVGPQLVALPEQGAGLDEPQGQPLGLEPQVAGPVGLILGEDPADGPLQDLHAAGAVEAAEEDLLDGGPVGGRRHLGGGADQERALGGGVEQFVEGGAAELDVVQDDDRADLPGERAQFVRIRAVPRGVVDGLDELVQEVGGGAVESGEPDHSVGGEVQAVLGDEVEQRGTAGAAGAGEPHGAAAGQQPDQALAFVLSFHQGERRLGGAGRHGRAGGALGGGALAGPVRPPDRRAELYLAAVDGVDGQQQVAGDELRRTGERGRALTEVGGEGFPGRAAARRLAVLLGSPVDRVHGFHGFKPPKASCARIPAPPGLVAPRCRFWSGPARSRVARRRATEP